MDRLPSELLTLVGELLNTAEIASLRLVSRFFCKVFTPFLMSGVHLVFKPESFKRLIAISKHPVISHYITSIVYESNTLEARDRGYWEICIRPDDFHNFENGPVVHGSMQRRRKETMHEER